MNFFFIVGDDLEQGNLSKRQLLELGVQDLLDEWRYQVSMEYYEIMC